MIIIVLFACVCFIMAYCQHENKIAEDQQRIRTQQRLQSLNMPVCDENATLDNY
jgi:YbbR domain-containing protein